MKWLRAHPANRAAETMAVERPLLNAPCGRDFFFGDVTVDAYVLPVTARADIRHLPFKDDSFAAVFSDPPWEGNWRGNWKEMMHEFLRVAPIAYILGPFVYGSKEVRVDWIMVAWRPGVQYPLMLIRYTRGSVYARVPEGE